jgi:hypothetical protein
MVIDVGILWWFGVDIKSLRPEGFQMKVVF